MHYLFSDTYEFIKSLLAFIFDFYTCTYARARSLPLLTYIFAHKYCCKNANCFHTLCPCYFRVCVLELLHCSSISFVLFVNGFQTGVIVQKNKYEILSIYNSPKVLSYTYKKIVRPLKRNGIHKEAGGFNRPGYTSEHFSSSCTAFIAFRSWHSWRIFSISCMKL